MRAHHERLIQQAVRAERDRRELQAALVARRKEEPRPRGKKTPATVVWTLVRRLAAGSIPRAASLLAVSPATLRRWLRDGAPAAQQWRIHDAQEQLRLGAETFKRNANAMLEHLQQALVGGLLPERTTDAEYKTSSQRRIGRRLVRTWRWPVVTEETAKRIIAWFKRALPDSRRKLWQFVIGYAQLGVLPSEERDGYRGGKNVAYQPDYNGPELALEEEIVVDSYWNSPVCESRAAALRALEAHLTEVVGALASGTIQRLDVTEARNFEWRRS